MRIDQDGVAATLPVTSDEIAAHFATLGLSGSDVASVNLYVMAATAAVEDYAGLALIQREVRLYLDAWPMDAGQTGLADYDWIEAPISYANGARNVGAVELPIGPVAAGQVAVVSAINTDNVATVLSGAAFSTESGRWGWLRQKGSYSLIQANNSGRFLITYTAGYGATSVQVPADLRLAVLDQALKLYEQRGDEDASPALSGTAKRLAQRYRAVRL